MMYQSTRDKSIRVTSAQAITQGISIDKGLFVPEEIPTISLEEIKLLTDRSYVERAKYVLKKYLTDFSEEEITDCVESAYSLSKFRNSKIAPLHKYDESASLLELWHGPTCAFKDMALQILPHLMRVSATKAGKGEEIVILVATSGDTGKAALEGFRDAKNTKICVFYPENGVSKMQKLQMATQEGDNVSVFAIRGNFDDAQNGVKAIFTNSEVRNLLEINGKKFSSANSINWGRLVPQIVYYISAYCDLVSDGQIALGDSINVTVPTGNFGNILAAYYARKMGLPIAKLICASNQNRVLTDFFGNGVYDKRREFYLTSSPSMDILISSNLERLLFDLSDKDDKLVVNWMNHLGSDGVYQIPDSMKEKIDSIFVGGCCTEEETAKTIEKCFKEKGYLMDTHTAVAMNVYLKYREQTKDMTKTVIASTANPYKFPASVLRAISGNAPEDDFECVDVLQQVTHTQIPGPLAGLKEKPVRFSSVCDKDNMKESVLAILGIG